MARKDKDGDDTEPLDLSKPATLEDMIRLMSTVGGMQNEQLVAAFAQALKQTAPPRQIDIGEYDPKTPWHPNKETAEKLTRQCFQNGFPMREENLHDAEIRLLNKIDRSGRYIHRLVEVILAEDGADDVIYIRYRNKTNDQRNDIARNVRSLEDMLTQIITAQEQAEQELIDAGRPSKTKRRPYFDAGGDDSIAP